VNKFNVTFSESTHGVLSNLAQRMEVSMSEVIREALSVYWWIAKEQSTGGRLLIQRGDEVTQLAIPSLARLGQDAVANTDDTEQMNVPASFHTENGHMTH
jgi:Ribbon-helix-helix protein, copG family